MPNQNPEQIARDKIDKILHYKKIPAHPQTIKPLKTKTNIKPLPARTPAQSVPHGCGLRFAKAPAATERRLFDTFWPLKKYKSTKQN